MYSSPVINHRETYPKCGQITDLTNEAFIGALYKFFACIPFAYGEKSNWIFFVEKNVPVSLVSRGVKKESAYSHGQPVKQ